MAASAVALASAPSESVVPESFSVGTAADVVKSVTTASRREKPEMPSVMLAPLASAKLWGDVGRLGDKKWFDTPFVARTRRACLATHPTFLSPPSMQFFATLG
jgi:hypothetical protein